MFNVHIVTCLMSILLTCLMSILLTCLMSTLLTCPALNFKPSLRMPATDDSHNTEYQHTASTNRPNKHITFSKPSSQLACTAWLRASSWWQSRCWSHTRPPHTIPASGPSPKPRSSLTLASRASTPSSCSAQWQNHHKYRKDWSGPHTKKSSNLVFYAQSIITVLAGQSKKFKNLKAQAIALMHSTLPVSATIIKIT